MPYASTYAEHCHASLVAAREVIERASRELAELIEGIPQHQDAVATSLADLITDIVTDAISDEMREAAEQYDDSNPLRRTV